MKPCPKCGKEIDYLNNFCDAIVKYVCLYEPRNEKGLGDWIRYEYEENEGVGHMNDYCCPFCGETLFTDETEAEAFLREANKEATNADTANTTNGIG